MASHVTKNSTLLAIAILPRHFEFIKSKKKKKKKKKEQHASRYRVLSCIVDSLGFRALNPRP